jgi:hypothetical protein
MAWVGFLPYIMALVSFIRSSCTSAMAMRLIVIVGMQGEMAQKVYEDRSVLGEETWEYLE